jgi:hypothetical protein
MLQFQESMEIGFRHDFLRQFFQWIQLQDLAGNCLEIDENAFGNFSNYIHLKTF